MSRGLFSAFIVGSIILFSGCSYKYTEVPLATNFESSTQKKLQSAHHWGVVSYDIAEEVMRRIGEDTSLFVDKSQQQTEFSDAIYKLLKSSLVKKGATVSVDKADTDALVSIDIQKIRFHGGREKPSRTFGIPTMLTAGVWALREIFQTSDTTGIVATSTATLAIGTDAYNWYNSEYALGLVPCSEVLVSVSVSKDNIYIANFSNVYYISDDDSDLYKNGSNGLKMKGD